MGRRIHSFKLMRNLCPRLRYTHINSKHHWINTNVSPPKSHINLGFSKSQITSLLCQNLTSSKTIQIEQCVLYQKDDGRNESQTEISQASNQKNENHP